MACILAAPLLKLKPTSVGQAVQLPDAEGVYVCGLRRKFSFL